MKTQTRQFREQTRIKYNPRCSIAARKRVQFVVLVEFCGSKMNKKFALRCYPEPANSYLHGPFLSFIFFFFQLTMNQKSPAIRYQLPLESCLEDSPGPNPMPVASWTVCHGVLGRDRIGLPRPGVIRRFSFAKKNFQTVYST